MDHVSVAQATEHQNAEREVLLVSWTTLLWRGGIPLLVIGGVAAIRDASWGTFIGLFVFVGILLALSLPRSLVIDQEGFRRRQLLPLVPSRKLHWAEIERFTAGDMRGWPMVYYDLADRRRLGRRLRRRVFYSNRGDGGFAPIFARTHSDPALSTTELAQLLTHRLHHARRVELTGAAR